MKLAVITSSYPRFPGDGTAPFVQSICEHLVQLGHAVEVVAPYDPAVKPVESGGVRVHRFRYTWPDRLHIMGHARSLEADVRLKPLAYLLLPFFLAAGLSTLLRVTARQKSQAIHAHWVLPNGLVAAWAAAWRGLPFVVSLHGSDMYLASRSKLFGAAARYVFRRATAVTACSPELRQAALALGAPEGTLLLPWGADPERFHPNQRRAETRESYGTAPGEVSIAGLGRLVPKKGFDRLLEALPAVLAGQPQARLVLGGDGPLRESLARRAASLGVSERVTFAGRVPWDCVPEFLAAADIFVLPSVRDEKGNVDGLPTVLLEAMSSGVAVVASDIGGVSLVVEHGRTGLSVPPGNVEALVEAILSLAGDADRRRTLGQAARQAVVERFNWDDVARQIAGLLEGAQMTTASTTREERP
jgi:glycosyltransferase involved in cell wall biosynthesis